jgi:hypothetical protein
MRARWLLAAGLLLAVAGCGDVTPLGPTTAPRPQHLRTPIVLRAVRVQPPTPAGGCPAGYTAFTAGPCYRDAGTPVTIITAAVTISPETQSASGQSSAPAQYNLVLILPVAERAALTSITTTAYDVQGGLTVSVAGRTWGSIPMVDRPFTGEFEIFPLTMAQAEQLQRMLT